MSHKTLGCLVHGIGVQENYEFLFPDASFESSGVVSLEYRDCEVRAAVAVLSTTHRQ